MKESQAHYEARCSARLGRTRARVHREMIAAFEADWSTSTVFPCGCRVQKVNDTLAIEPCELNCYVLGMFEEAGPPVSAVIVDPAADQNVATEAIRRWTQ